MNWYLNQYLKPKPEEQAEEPEQNEVKAEEPEQEKPARRRKGKAEE